MGWLAHIRVMGIVLCLYPALAEARPRLPSPNMRAIAWMDQSATQMTARRAAMAWIGHQSPPVDTHVAPRIAEASMTMRYRIAASTMPLSPEARALREMSAIIARKPKVLSLRPLVSLTVDTADRYAPTRIGGAAFAMLGMAGTIDTIATMTEEEWRRGWDSNPR